MMKRLLLLGISIIALAGVCQTTGKKNPSIYDQLDKSQPITKAPAPQKPAVVNYDREIARLQLLLDEEKAKPAPDPGHVAKLSYHIQDMKIKKQNDPNKLINLNAK